MKTFIKISTCLLIASMLFSMSSCTQNTQVTTATTDTESETAALYYVGAETRTIMDDGEMELSINCNYFVNADNCDMYVQVIDPADAVVYEYHEVFISGTTYSATLTPEDCGIDRFVGGDYTISVSNSYNSYVGKAVVHTTPYPENTIISAEEGTVGTIDNLTYTNDYFGITFESPSGFLLDDLIYYVDTMNGYTVDYVSYSEDGTFAVLNFVGHMYYDKEISLDELVDYAAFTLPPDDYEIVNLDGIDFVEFVSQRTRFYMTLKDSDILVIALAYIDEDDPNLDIVSSSIKSTK